jgi:peroxiredoxin
MQLGQLQTIEKKLLKLGYQIIAVSPDKPENLNSSIEKQQLEYTLLSDSAMSAAQAMGIAYRVDDMTFKRLNEYGIDIEESSGQKHHLLPVPAVFLIDKNGTIKFQYVNPNYKTRLDPEILMVAAKIALKK